MYISPPIAVLAILAAGLASGAWLDPPREAMSVTITLPEATYQKLSLWGKERSGEDGQPLSVAQVIEELATEMGEQ